jgi:hypothetical protein
MAEKLRRYYDYAGKKGGFTLQLKLAMRTLMAGNRAAEAPDTPENLELFRQALTELLPGEDDVPKL